MALAASITKTDCEKRRVERQPLPTAAKIRQGTRRDEVEVVDISIHGARLRTIDPLRAGARIGLKLPWLESLECTVTWVDRFEAGCAFATPLHPASLAVILQKARLRQ